MRIHTRYRRLFMGLLVLALVMIPAADVFAEGTTQILLSSNSVEVGKRVKATIKGSKKSRVTVKYNDKALEFVRCSSSNYATDGNKVIFRGKKAKITFKGVAAGRGDLIVSSDSLSGSSTSITVTGESDDNDSNTSGSGTKPANGDYTINGETYVLSERYTDEEVPTGFERTSMSIHGGTYSEPKSAFMTLVYLKPAAHTEGKGVFYIYNESDDSVSPFWLIGKAKGSYVIVTAPDEMVSDKLVEADFTYDDRSCKGYRLEGIENDFYFLHGVNDKGDYDWYEFDSRTGSIQRVNTELLRLAASGGGQGASVAEGEDVFPKLDKDQVIKSTSKALKHKRNIIALCTIIGVVLFIIIMDIILFKRKARKKEDEAVFNEMVNEEADYVDEGIEVFNVDNLLEAGDFEEANKPHKSGVTERIVLEEAAEGNEPGAVTGTLPNVEDRSRIKKQVFVKRATGTDDTKIDVVDFNDL